MGRVPVASGVGFDWGLAEALLGFQAFTVMYFHASIANPPSLDLDGEAMTMHTVPFMVLMLGLLALAITHTWLGSSGQWKKLGVTRPHQIVQYVHVVCLATFTFGKLLLQLNGLVGGVAGKGFLFCNSCHQCTLADGQTVEMPYLERKLFLAGPNGTAAGVTCEPTSAVAFTQLWDYAWLVFALPIPLGGALIAIVVAKSTP